MPQLVLSYKTVLLIADHHRTVHNNVFWQDLLSLKSLKEVVTFLVLAEEEQVDSYTVADAVVCDKTDHHVRLYLILILGHVH